MNSTPLIMLTNDDGIESPRLRALIRSVHSLGDLLVVAPRHQQSATSRSYWQRQGEAEQHMLHVDGTELRAYSIDATPAQTVRHGLLRFAARKPDLIISGINYGENVGAGLTVSGTVGAAWEGAAMGVPALAVSLEVEIEHHFAHSESVEFRTAAHFAHQFAEAILRNGLPLGVEIINVNVPQHASLETAWRLTRVSSYSHFHTIVEVNEYGEKVLAGYHRQFDFDKVEEDSDVYILFKEQQVSVTPLTIDATAHTPSEEILRRLP
ncbi:MAG: 5'/3'-nucleotidase SurE, partial [Chloroflexi bacterium]|nr:5'/3'-nucleotidase SurE [Chloroflexota bacterium]